MRCWGSSKGLAVALCWSPGLRRSTRQRRGWTGTGKNAKQGSRTYLGMVTTVLGARQTPSYLQIRVVFAGSLSLSGKMGRVGCDKCKCRVAALMGIRVSRRQQAVTCKSLPRTCNGGRWGGFHLGLSPARPGIQRPTSNTKPPRTNWKEPGSFPRTGLNQNTELPI